MNKYQELLIDLAKHQRKEKKEKWVFWTVYWSSGLLFFTLSLISLKNNSWWFLGFIIIEMCILMWMQSFIPKNNSNDIKKKLLSSEYEFNIFEQFKEDFLKCVNDKRYLIKENTNERYKILFSLVNYVIICQKTDDQISFVKIHEDGTEDKELMEKKYIKEFVMNNVASLLRKERVDHDNLINEVKDLFKEKREDPPIQNKKSSLKKEFNE